MVRRCLSLVAATLPIPDAADESIHGGEPADAPPGHLSEVRIAPAIETAYNGDYGVAKQEQEV